MDYNWKMVLRMRIIWRDFPLLCFDLPNQKIRFDLRLLGGWKKTYSHIFPQMVVKNGDESHGRICKKQKNEHLTASAIFWTVGWHSNVDIFLPIPGAIGGYNFSPQLTTEVAWTPSCHQAYDAYVFSKLRVLPPTCIQLLIPALDFWVATHFCGEYQRIPYQLSGKNTWMISV